MSEALSFDLAWGKLAAQAWGPIHGRPVLALHGWLDNSESFATLAPLLAGDLRVIALDLPGHGHSAHRPAGTNYHLLDSIYDILEVADQLGWWQFTWIGHSLGGAIASLAAGAFPERFERLVLIDALGPFTSDEETLPERMQQYYLEKKELAKKRLPIYPNPEAAVKARLTAGTLKSSSAARIVARSLEELAGGKGWTWRSDPRLRLPSAPRLSEAQVRACFKRIECPTLLLKAAGGLDLPTPGQLKKRIDSIRHLVFREVPGNHHVHLDDPEVVAPWIHDFFERSQPRQGQIPLSKSSQTR